MRRTPSRDSMTLIAAGGAATVPAEAPTNFDSAFRELASARAAYDSVAGNPDAVPNLAAASVRLAAARKAMGQRRAA